MPDSVARPTREQLPADWARAVWDPEAFAAEQKSFAHIWTFLGVASDVALDGDWIRATIGLRSVFVQRIRGELKGFENRCAHRFFPLRVADKGNGPIVCGFHHWRYDEEGRAIGIPACKEAFGVVSRGLNAALDRIDVAVCGSLIFGRFPSPDATDSLDEFLGPAFAVLAALSRMKTPPLRFSRPVEAHWKLCMHLAVDDYHIAAIHPATFGKGGVYLDRKHITYTRSGAHSIYQAKASPTAFADLLASLAGGTARADHYIVVHLMPGMVLANAYIWDGYHACALIHYAPVNHHRSMQRTWIFPSPLVPAPGRTPRLLRPVRDALLHRIAAHYGRRILDEDAVAAERLQTNAATFTSSALIGTLEERVLWYETAYRDIVSGTRGKPEV